MFGILSNTQDIYNKDNCNYGRLLNNSEFIGITITFEDHIYYQIENSYNKKDKKNFIDLCNYYKNMKFTKYLDLINKYISNYQD